MASQLMDAVAQRSHGVVLAAAPALRAPTLTETTYGVIVILKAKVSDDLLNAINGVGGKVLKKFPAYDEIRAAVPLQQLETLAARPDVDKVDPDPKASKNRAIASEGDRAHMALEARTTFGVGGKGVTVGVLSDSIDDGNGALQTALDSRAIDAVTLSAMKDETGEVQDGMNIEGTEVEGEGLAMAEIIHAIAPDAHIVFATGLGGPAQIASNILELANQGCQIIVDDMTYFNESPFQDGPIAQAVNTVSDRGVLYFSSARNSGNKIHDTSGTWEGDFVDGGPAGAPNAADTVGPIGGGPKGSQYAADANGRIHVFTVNRGRRITLNTVRQATRDDRVDLFWSDPLGNSSNDYDLFVVNQRGQVVQASTTTHNALVKQDPYQSIEHLETGQSIVIVKNAGAESRFLHLDTGSAIIRYGTGGSVRGHNASGAKNAFSVAATPVSAPPVAFRTIASPTVETFSSDGPRRQFYDAAGTPLTPGNLSGNGGVLLNKPDLAAADGVSTTLPPKSHLNPFYGTSAAAPHAAAIAALLISCDPRVTTEQMRKALVGSAIATDGDAPNFTAGYGIVMADEAAIQICRNAPTP